jgi:hypothetical protein
MLCTTSVFHLCIFYHICTPERERERLNNLSLTILVFSVSIDVPVLVPCLNNPVMIFFSTEVTLKISNFWCVSVMTV